MTLRKPKPVCAEIKRKNIASGGEVDVPLGGIHE